MSRIARYLVFMAVFICGGGAAWAISGGIQDASTAASTCSACHVSALGNRTSTARVCTGTNTTCTSDSPTSTVVKGRAQAYTASLTLQGADGRTLGGFNLSATGGTLSETSSVVRTITGLVAMDTQLTHPSPTSKSVDVITWPFTWTAPSVTADTTQDLRMCAQPVDGDGGADNGDGPPDCVVHTVTLENNATPVITTIPDQTHNVGSNYAFDVSATDTNGGEGSGEFTYSLTQRPSVTMTINATTGVIDWSSGNLIVGTHTVTVTATDLSGASDSATFLLTINPQFTLTVVKAGTGSGTVTSSPAGITCGSTCSAPFASGTSVTLTATADGGSTFAALTGGGCNGTSTCTVSMTQARNITATLTFSRSR